MKLVVDDENVSGAPMQLMVIVEQMRCSETEMMAEPNCRHSGGGSQIATVELGFAVCARRAQYHRDIRVCHGREKSRH